MEYFYPRGYWLLSSIISNNTIKLKSKIKRILKYFSEVDGINLIWVGIDV